MKIPFLQHLPGWRTPPVQRVVASAKSEAEAAVLRQLLAELPDLLLAAVLDLATGQPLATYAAEAAYQPARPALAAAEALRQLQAGLAAQGQPATELQEVILTLPSQLHLLRMRPGGRQFLYLVADAHDTNLALVRQLAQQVAEQQ